MDLPPRVPQADLLAPPVSTSIKIKAPLLVSERSHTISQENNKLTLDLDLQFMGPLEAMGQLLDFNLEPEVCPETKVLRLVLDLDPTVRLVPWVNLES